MNIQDILVTKTNNMSFLQEIVQKKANKSNEVQFRMKNGKLIDCLLKTSIQRCQDGNIICNQGIIHDITEKKRVEEALTSVRNRLRNELVKKTRNLLEETKRVETIIETLPVGILVFTMDGTFQPQAS